jgi:hypothetical protein
VNEVDRRAALACLAALELNMAELYGIDAWRERIGQECLGSWRVQMALVRAYQRDLQSLGQTLDEANDADGG